MLSANGLRVGAAAVHNLTIRVAGASPALVSAQKIAALNAFRALPTTRSFMTAKAVNAPAAASPKKTATATKAKKTTTKAAPKKKSATALAADKKKAAAEKKKKAAAKAAATAAAAKKKAALAKKKAAQTPEEKARLQKKELKKVALLDEPRKLPETPWILFVTESTKGTKTEGSGKANLTRVMPELSASFKSLSPLEVQRLRDTAEKNRATNAEAYKAWVESHTASQVADANRARQHLNRLGKTSKHRNITDARQPKRAIASFSLFTKERWESGEFTGRPLAEAARTLSAEWKNISSADRQHYEDLAKAEQNRYDKEYEAAFGTPPPSKTVSPAA
ncbi:hypothetical protein Sste5346_007422 [Sporothrix stenoceras]|uniref:HMG box domain-containing protein n=1 Tax=Sporothrix stenoceras TaxID=5173 RepID=A0ABR3YVF9_9PEZI